ncbi:MAG: NADPH-dependent F420 reductase [Chloroflexi bacterium]|nr:NADPH-dependent F420 reductase [Chloroflexota bacterium]
MTEAAANAVRTIAILGGTGKEGKGLAYRWAKKGYRIIIGSRQVEKAQAAANDILSLLDPGTNVTGMANGEAAAAADLAVMTVPYSAHRAMLESVKDALKGKILIDVTVPLVPPKVTKVQMPAAGSASQEAQQILGDDVQVVAAFQNISYEHLLHDEPVHCDVLVCGSGKSARQIVLRLVSEAGLVGWDAGPIENSVVVEGMTSILIGINKQYGVESSGIVITGVPRPESA